MASPMDHVEYLSKEIGARPAGTEEEQQAAFYIADEFQKQAGFPAEIEEFTSSSNLEGGRAILAMVTIVVSVLAMLFNILTAPAFILAVVAAVIYTMEAYDRPVLSRLLARGESQNVVAKYQPSAVVQPGKKGQRQRKIVLVAHYDTGKVTPGIVKRIEGLGLPLGSLCVGGMVAAAFFLLLRIFVGGTGGVGLIFVNFLTIIAIIIVALPIVKAILYRAAPYNEGANNNASGVAALLEVATRIGSGTMSEADLLEEFQEPVIHGAQAAIESDLLPEGAELVYETAPTTDEAPDYDGYSEEDRLLAAKAAIAALTGKPVEQRVFGDVSAERPAPEPRESFIAPTEVPAPEPVAPTPEPAVEPQDGGAAGGFENAPSWFVAAQRNAKRPTESQPVQRSRYTEAIQAAEQTLADRERARQEEERARRERENLERAAATRAALSALRSESQPAEILAPKAEIEEPPAQSEVLASSEVEAEALPAIIPDSAEEAAEEVEQLTDAAPELEPLAPIEDPGSFADRLEGVDLGQTIAYTPAMIRKAIQEEMELAEKAEAARSAEGALDRIAALEIETGQSEARKRLSELPTVTSEAEAPAENVNPSRSGMFRMLRSDVPSLDGEDREPAASPLESAMLPRIELGPQAEEEPEALANDAQAEPEAVDYDMELPVSDELIDAAKAQSPAAGDEGSPAAGEGGTSERDDEFAAPNEVTMPKSRAGGLLGRFKKKDSEKLDNSPQEWLDVDEDFEARAVGRERGSWESFRESGAADGKWEGGAFSRIRLGHVDERSSEGGEADEPDILVEDAEDRLIAEEIEHIYHFRNPDYDAEIWFVALGSDTELHDGAKAFAEAHKQDLRGAMIIEVESLGLGVLSAASEEGQFRRIQASSRIKRFTRAASEATGIVLDRVRTTTDSATTTLQKAGLQAMHLMGIEDGRPALKGDADDIFENVDELLLEENINYLMALLKQEQQ